MAVNATTEGLIIRLCHVRSLSCSLTSRSSVLPVLGLQAQRRNIQELGKSDSAATLVCFTLFVLVLVLAFPVPLLAWEGRCTGISDGDTVKVLHDGQEVKIRLASIDCPERGQPFSKRAKHFTADFVFGKTVRVEPVTTDRYGRTVAWIHVEGVNVNHEIVKAGLGWWFRKYAPNDNVVEGLEEKARQEKVGLWTDPNPIPPWEWRKAKKMKQ